MPRKILKKYQELKYLENVTEYSRDSLTKFDLAKKKRVIVELACGYGEYSLELARNNPDDYFIGIDIQGERLWKGAKKAIEEDLGNIHFIRVDISHIAKIFKKSSIDEIWITFPDPQPSKPRKRLTNISFLDQYKKILKAKGEIYLKTDDQELYEFSLGQLTDQKASILEHTSDLYSSTYVNEKTSIQSRYEQKFGERGIKYIKWTYK